MRFFYLLSFESDTGHVGHFALHLPTGRIYSRMSFKGGEFSRWRRLDVTRRADGTLNEKVYEADRAQTADTAGRLRTPIKISFTGDVNGVVTFDGSMNVSCALSIPALATLEKRIKDIEESLTNNPSNDW